MKIFLSPAAASDLAEIHEYLVAQNPIAAIQVIAKIKSRLQDIALFPHSGRLGSVAGTRELVLSGLPFVVPYRLKLEEIEIIRIYHTSRQPLASFPMDS